MSKVCLIDRQKVLAMSQMRLILTRFIAAILLSFSAATPLLAVDRKLVFADEFNGASGSPVDLTKWTPETGGWGWGNKELQSFSTSGANTYQDGNGSLVIKAVKLTPPLSVVCWYGPCSYTSGRLLTKGKFDQKFGRFEARIKIPRGQGIWPAFWLLGNDFDKVGWPNCGEIDIMENIGREPSSVHGTIHGPGYSGGNAIGGKYDIPKDKLFADDYHTYAVEWSSIQIRWYVDDKLYRTIGPRDLPSDAKWVFDHPFFVILNLAVGGDWPGNPDDSSSFPQMMMVDYVRVYSR